jgi:serine/threonine-protein kinase HipA
MSHTGVAGHGNNLEDSAPYGRIEYAYYQLASLAGIEMAPCILLAEGPSRHFMTRRFDRTAEGGKLHLASLCALAELDFKFIGAHSYDQLLQVFTRLDLGHDAMAEAYRRMVFNVAAANHNDHSKNFAFLCDSAGNWSLAPAFDVTHAYRSDSVWSSRHLLSVNDRFIDITIEDLYVVGECNKVPDYRRIVRQVLAAVDQWRELAESAEVPVNVISSMAADLDRIRPR